MWAVRVSRPTRTPTCARERMGGTSSSHHRQKKEAETIEADQEKQPGKKHSDAFPPKEVQQQQQQQQHEAKAPKVKEKSAKQPEPIDWSHKLPVNQTIPTGCRDARCFAARSKEVWDRHCNPRTASSASSASCDSDALLKAFNARNGSSSVAHWGDSLWGCEWSGSSSQFPPTGRLADFGMGDRVEKSSGYGNSPGQNLRWRGSFKGPLARALVVVVAELWGGDNATSFAALVTLMCNLHHVHPTADFFVALAGDRAAPSRPLRGKASLADATYSPYLGRVQQMAGEFNAYQGLSDWGTNIYDPDLLYNKRGHVVVEAVPPPPPRGAPWGQQQQQPASGYPFVQSLQAALDRTKSQSYSHVVALSSELIIVNRGFPLLDLDCPVSYFGRFGFVASHWAAAQVVKEAAALSNGTAHEDGLELFKRAAARSLGVNEATCPFERIGGTPPQSATTGSEPHLYVPILEEIIDKPKCGKAIVSSKKVPASGTCESLGYDKWVVTTSLCSVLRRHSKWWWNKNKYNEKPSSSSSRGACDKNQ